MPPLDTPSPSNPGPSRKKSYTMVSTLVSLALLVAIIGGIAWVTQYLPSWNRKPPTPVPSSDKAALAFARSIAQWGAKPEPGGEETFFPRDYETGTKGFYDFPFKNSTDVEVEIAYYSSSCDCTSVQACALEAEDFAAINAQHQERPGEPLRYPENVAWVDLLKEAIAKSSGAKRTPVRVKAGAGGVVRVHWLAKPPGPELNVAPRVWFHPAGDANRLMYQQLGVPLLVAPPVRFHPARVIMDSLTANTSTRKEFYAWSSTRDHFVLKLTASANDQLFEATATPVRAAGIFARSECPELYETSDPKKPKPHVRSVQRITLTVHESRGGQYLDLGSYHRRLAVMLDGIPNPDIVGPEIVGRVHGEISIGGADDQGKIRFQTFNARDGARKSVELSADAAWVLSEHKHEPAWINVKLTKAPVQDQPKRTLWRLSVSIPPQTIGVRSLDDPDAIILRISGTPERFVRIPIEGTLIAR